MPLFGNAAKEVEELNRSLNDLYRTLDEEAAKGRTVDVAVNFIPAGPLIGNPTNRPDRIGAGSGGGAGGIFGNTTRGQGDDLVDENGRPFRIGGGGGNSGGIFGNTGFGSGRSAVGNGIRTQVILPGSEAVVPPGTTAPGVEAQVQAQKEQTEVLRAILNALLTNADARRVITGILARNEEGI